ncbi:hypothetical protein PSTT_00305 [Puccinia striiformis]|uniref:Uncharacterized protein n=1 Tax=Puccinia striiformis TaxID=27350 RepID=A0A2S4W749_9BASI|nr:hypothetical protein PSTT_00305 [Puccinia striiformis]
MPRSTGCCRQAIPAKSKRHYNKQMSSVLPSLKTPFCQSIYDFTKMLIGTEYTRNDTPVLCTTLNKSVLDDRIVFLQAITLASSPDLVGKKQTSSAWNETLVRLISKHWTYASAQGAFSAYPINPEHETPETILGAPGGWFNGQREIVRKGMTKTELEKTKLAKKKCKRRSIACTLATHQTTSMKSLIGDNSPCVVPFEESRCHSDTEDLPNGATAKLKLSWRSAVFAALSEMADWRTVERSRQEAGRCFSSSQLLKTRCSAAMREEEDTMVPMNLPLDCYDDGFLKSLSDQQARHELTNKPPCGLVEIYFQLVQKRPSDATM